jgi:hypothetical protein
VQVEPLPQRIGDQREIPVIAGHDEIPTPERTDD